MVIKLDFNECLKDSPLFRKNLAKAENDLELFESVYKKVFFIYLRNFEQKLHLHIILR